MKNVLSTCVRVTNDPQIKFEENGRKIIFQNPNRSSYKTVQVDGCAITTGVRCDKLLTSYDEHSEYFVELKGCDVKHAIEQLEKTIALIGEFADNRHSYIICTKVAPAMSTTIQNAKSSFKRRYHSELIVRESYLSVGLR
jgi:hypothetical protein